MADGGYRPVVVKFHAIGDWPPGRVRTAWVESTRRKVDAVEHAVERAWAAAQNRPNVRLFDGPMCRLESADVSSETLDLRLSPVGYKTFFGTQLVAPTVADRFGSAVLANPVGVSVALQSADGWLMLGRRGGNVAYYPHRLHPFAGALEPGDSREGNGPPDVFVCALRELQEELHLPLDALEPLRCVGWVEDMALRQPEIVLLGGVRRTFEDLSHGLDPAEHCAIEAVIDDPEAIDRQMNDSALTPVAVAAVLLWGRRRFGSAWFEQTTTKMNIVTELPANRI